MLFSSGDARFPLATPSIVARQNLEIQKLQKLAGGSIFVGLFGARGCNGAKGIVRQGPAERLGYKTAGKAGEEAAREKAGGEEACCSAARHIPNAHDAIPVCAAGKKTPNACPISERAVQDRASEAGRSDACCRQAHRSGTPRR